MRHKARYGFPGILVSLACAALMVPACSQLGSCVASVTRPDAWVPAAITLGFVGGATVLSWSIRVLYLVSKTAYLLQRLPLEEWPTGLRTAVDHTGAARVVCVSTGRPLAFCAGIVWPRIYVTPSLVAHLRPMELDAVLLHEQHHSRRRDPVRLAAGQALADVCFYLPLLQWWARRRREDAELRADRAAIEAAGRAPVAGALWALATSTQPLGTAAFHGSPEPRAAQVLGDTLLCRRPGRALWLASGAGLLSGVATLGCLAQLLLLR